MSLLTPWLGRTVTAMVVIRIMQGLFEGVTFPCIHDVWLYWAPISERSRMASIAYAGMYIGTVLTMPIRYESICNYIQIIKIKIEKKKTVDFLQRH